MWAVRLQDPRLYINREVSWLAFNDRVLAEAKSAALPVYERLKFLGIVSSNLDEFFMVRVAGLKQQLTLNLADTGADGLLPGEQLTAIAERSHAMVAEQYRLWNEELVPALAAVGVTLLSPAALSAEQRAAARAHFHSAAFSALTPLAVDAGHPFPHLRNKSLNLAVLLRKEGRRKKREGSRENLLAVVQVPAVLPRLVPLPSGGAGGQAYLLLDELIAAQAGDLFPGYSVVGTAAFRVTRNWDLELDEDESDDLLHTIQEELRRRDRGAAVRLEIHASASADLERQLTEMLNLTPADVYRQAGPLQLNDLMALGDNDPRAEVRVEPLVPAVPPALRDADSMFQAVGAKDVLLHHPYESFEPVVRLLSEAAEDPQVLAIKMTLYRTSGDSPFVRALSRAAENGKQVAVLVELKARFDEANNIAWARRLEETGVHVVYGLVGLKTHCKVALVVRREGARIRRYVHIGTGNYNPTTARQYTDLSLLTTREEIADDCTALFNMLTGYADAPNWKRLAVAPLGLQHRVLDLIGREALRARKGEPARILAKMNSLVDPDVIRALYEASGAGVEIDLLIRGICCLRPGVPGVSERIRVSSVVDRFLEHSRVCAFGVGERTEVYLSSADWMPRNFHRRVEVMCPVEEPALRARLLDEALGVGLRDTVKARRLQVDGSYVAAEAVEPGLRSQMVLLELARRVSGAQGAAPTVIRHVAAPPVPDKPTGEVVLPRAVTTPPAA
jgi:polyphosphate kinase